MVTLMIYETTIKQYIMIFYFLLLYKLFMDEDLNNVNKTNLIQFYNILLKIKHINLRQLSCQRKVGSLNFFSMQKFSTTE